MSTSQLAVLKLVARLVGAFAYMEDILFSNSFGFDLQCKFFECVI
jgi:hypothetical protein